MIKKVDIRKSWQTALTISLLLGGSGALLAAQDDVEWFTLGNDYANTRYTTSSEITAENFSELEVVWEWDGASHGAASGRSTPSYINGTLYTVAGARRHVVAIDPKTGEQLWSYRLPNTCLLYTSPSQRDRG